MLGRTPLPPGEVLPPWLRAVYTNGIDWAGAALIVEVPGLSASLYPEY